MSAYTRMTKHPDTGEWHIAWWIDNHFGRHQYGVQFPDGKTFNPRKVRLETRSCTPEESAAARKEWDAFRAEQANEPAKPSRSMRKKTPCENCGYDLTDYGENNENWIVIRNVCPSCGHRQSDDRMFEALKKSSS